MSIPPALDGGYQLWWYYTSVPGSIIFSVLFGLLTITHLTRIIQTGKRFCIPFVIGGIFETVGYVCRLLAHKNTSSVALFAVQANQILLAPILFAASAYMYLGRIMTAAGAEDLSIIKPRLLTRIFVSGDILCFVIQGAGGGIMASNSGSDKIVTVGENIILGGLVLQIILYLFFMLIGAVFHKQYVTMPDQNGSGWQKLLYSLHFVGVLIIVRNIVRTIEFATGDRGVLYRNDWTIFIFDGTCMVLVMGISLLWYQAPVGSKRFGKTPDSSKHGSSSVDIHMATV